MRALALALLASLLVAGCAADATDRALHDVGRAPEVRDPGEYWLVWAHGVERLEGAADEGAASRGFLPAFDHSFSADRWLALKPGRLPSASEARVVVAFDLRTEGDTMLLYDHRVNPGGMRAHFGAFGPVDLDVRDDGTLVVDGEEVPQGKKLVLTYTRKAEGGGRYEGEVTFENLGAWPQSQIELVSGR